MIRAVIFDFDGVIANSEPLHFAAFRDVLQREGLTFTEQQYYASYLGYDDAGVFRTVARDRHLPWTRNTIAGLLERKAVRLEELEREQAVLFPGAAAAITRLGAVFPLAIASGALREEIVRVLDHADLAKYFRAIVAAEDTVASKPAPDPYLLSVERLSAAIDEPLRGSDCVAIEDSRWGLESARAAGVRTIAITHTYPASSFETADLVINGLDELTAALLKALD